MVAIADSAIVAGNWVTNPIRVRRPTCGSLVGRIRRAYVVALAMVRQVAGRIPICRPETVGPRCLREPSFPFPVPTLRADRCRLGRQTARPGGACIASQHALARRPQPTHMVRRRVHRLGICGYEFFRECSPKLHSWTFRQAPVHPHGGQSGAVLQLKTSSVRGFPATAATGPQCPPAR